MSRAASTSTAAVRDLMAIAGQLVGDPSPRPQPGAAGGWWRALWRRVRSRQNRQPEADARQVQFHYDVSDDFYALWLGPRRVYSCAYYRERPHDAGAGAGKPSSTTSAAS